MLLLFLCILLHIVKEGGRRRAPLFKKFAVQPWYLISEISRESGRYFTLRNVRKAPIKAYLGTNKSASVIAISRPSTGTNRMKFKLRLSNHSSYISVYFNFKRNLIGGSRYIAGNIKVDMRYDIYFGFM